MLFVSRSGLEVCSHEWGAMGPRGGVEIGGLGQSAESTIFKGNVLHRDKMCVSCLRYHCVAFTANITNMYFTNGVKGRKSRVCTVKYGTLPTFNVGSKVPFPGVYYAKSAH